jgi:hypothetical protein
VSKDFEADLSKITEYANSKNPEDVASELKEANAFVQMAWLDFGIRKLEDHLRTMYATAYADFKGELKEVRLTLPEVDDDSE